MAMVEQGAPLTGLDNLWHLMGQISEFDPLVLSTFTFKDKVPLSELRKALKGTADAFPRFKQRLARHDDPARAPYFEDDPAFDIAKHVKEVNLPEGERDGPGFDRYVSSFVSTLWDYSRSPWDVMLCNDYEDEAGARSAVVFRSHHSIADGQGFIRAVLWATSYRPEIEKLIAGPLRKPQNGVSERKPQDFSSRAQATASWLGSNAIRSAWTVFEVIALAFIINLTWWRITNLTPSHRERRWTFQTPMSEKPSIARTYTSSPRPRRFARSTAVKLSDIKKVQKAFTGNGEAFQEGRQKLTTIVAGEHVTLNDVIVAVLAECMHRAKDRARAAFPPNAVNRSLDKVLPDRIACFIPMSFRKPGDPTTKNRSLGGLIYVPRPPATATPSRRTKRDVYESIHRAKFQLNIIKKSRTPQRLADYIVDPLAKIPLLFPWPGANVPVPVGLRRFVTTPIMNVALSSVHCVLTNVPGPATEPVSLSGHEIAGWTVAPPQGAVGTLGIGLLSYAGELRISVLADAVDGDEDGGLARQICDDFADTFAVYLRHADQIIRNA